MDGAHIRTGGAGRKRSASRRGGAGGGCDVTETAILVLGAAVKPGGVASSALERRALHAARLWHAGRATLIVPCGGTGRHPPAEAEVMQRLLVDAGIPDRAILPEAHSSSTAENIRFALPLLAARGVGHVLIVSDAWHLPRARLLARRTGLCAEGSSPPLSGARVRPQLRGALREIPAYLAELLRLRR